MTEQEWLECADPTPMLEFLRGKMVPEDLRLSTGRVIQVPSYPQSKISERKLRLFACSCCRRIWQLIRDQRSHTAVEVAERYADGRATEPHLREAGQAAEEAASYAYHAVYDPIEAEAIASGLQPEEWVDGAWEFASVASSAESAAFDVTAIRVADLGGWESAARAVSAAHHDRVADKIEEHAQAILLRCINGNPLRPVTVDPAWLTPTVVSLATAIYDERAFDRLPILADALEDAGCTNADILNHCRQPGEHARGCWVVDLLLGKH